MAEKLPVVVGPDGRPRQLGSTDALTTNAVSGAVTTSNSGSFDLATSRRYLRVLNGSNSSLSLTNDSDGAAFGIILQQDGVGNRTVLWWSGIYWYGTASPTTPPVLNTAPAAYDYVGFIRLSAGSYLGYAAECSTTAASTAASGSTSNEITQTSHGFSVGDAVYHTGTAYAKAQANADATSEVIGVVSAVAGANVFSLLTNGRITGLTGLTAGAVYFLSASTAGALTATEPSTTGHISKPVMVADSTTSGYVTILRGSIIGYGGEQYAATTTKRVIGRNTAGTGPAEEVTLSQLLDWLASVADGDGLVRSGGSWVRLPNAARITASSYVQTPANGTFTLTAKAHVACTINSIRGVKTSAGTCTVSVAINGTNVTGLASLSVTSTAQDATATAANTVAAGDRITLVVASVSGAADLEFTLSATRTG